jgi:hypothetical protein
MNRQFGTGTPLTALGCYKLLEEEVVGLAKTAEEAHSATLSTTSVAMPDGRTGYQVMRNQSVLELCSFLR